MITQRELARLTGIPLNTIIKYESNTRNLNKIDTLVKLCIALDCKMQELIDDELVDDFNKVK